MFQELLTRNDVVDVKQKSNNSEMESEKLERNPNLSGGEIISELQ